MRVYVHLYSMRSVEDGKIDWVHRPVLFSLLFQYFTDHVCVYAIHAFFILIVKVLARTSSDVQGSEVVLQELLVTESARVTWPQVVREVQLDL